MVRVERGGRTVSKHVTERTFLFVPSIKIKHSSGNWLWTNFLILFIICWNYPRLLLYYTKRIRFIVKTVFRLYDVLKVSVSRHEKRIFISFLNIKFEPTTSNRERNSCYFVVQLGFIIIPNSLNVKNFNLVHGAYCESWNELLCLLTNTSTYWRFPELKSTILLVATNTIWYCVNTVYWTVLHFLLVQLHVQF